MPDPVQEIKRTLQKLRLSPRKRLGQNFMVNDDDLAFLADSLCLKKGEAVLEIGPGLGSLTRRLLEKEARVIAVEKDAGFAAFL
ncbi:MAG: rRNA adenine N-6-methyltransferase family protein, partial [Candidatus Omnitrophota bacterium]